MIIEELRFFQGIKPWEAEKKIEEGQLLTANFGPLAGATFCVILSLLDRKTGKVLDTVELGPRKDGKYGDQFALVMQQQSVQWEPEMLTPRGLKMKINGFIGESRTVRETGEDFTFSEQIAFNPVATAATGLGRIEFQNDHGFDIGHWVTKTADGWVLAQPDDPLLRETTGRVSLVPSANCFIVECGGFGCDQDNTFDDNFWDYDVGTELILATDGGVTDVKPADRPYRSLGHVVDYGYFLINQRTVYPNHYAPWFEAWPSDKMLQAPLGQDGFRAFIYTGSEAGRQMGTYINPNAGKTGAVSAPTRI